MQNYKKPEDNTAENLDDFGYGYDFLDITLKSSSIKEIIEKLDIFKM
jgi:hypothetical protein